MTTAEDKCKLMSSSGWNKASLSLDASEEHDGYSSAEDPLNSDAEDDNCKKLVSHCARQIYVDLSVLAQSHCGYYIVFTRSIIWTIWQVLFSLECRAVIGRSLCSPVCYFSIITVVKAVAREASLIHTYKRQRPIQ